MELTITKIDYGCEDTIVSAQTAYGPLRGVWKASGIPAEGRVYTAGIMVTPSLPGRIRPAQAQGKLPVFDYRLRLNHIIAPCQLVEGKSLVCFGEKEQLVCEIPEAAGILPGEAAEIYASDQELFWV